MDATALHQITSRRPPNGRRASRKARAAACACASAAIVLGMLGLVSGRAMAHSTEPPPIPCPGPGESVPFEPLGARTAGCALLAGGESDAYQIAGEPGDRLRVVVQTFGPVDPMLVLRDPSGAVVLEFECDGGSIPPQACAEQAELVLEHPGPGFYELQVTDRDGNESGEYLLEVHRLPPSCDPAGCDVVELGEQLVDDGGLEAVTDLDHFLFEVGEPERVRIAVWKVVTPHTDPKLEILDADGALIAEAACAEDAPVESCRIPEVPCASIEVVLGGGGCSDELPCVLDAAISDAGNDDANPLNSAYCTSIERLPEPSNAALACMLGLTWIAAARRARRRL